MSDPGIGCQRCLLGVHGQAVAGTADLSGVSGADLVALGFRSCLSGGGGNGITAPAFTPVLKTRILELRTCAQADPDRHTVVGGGELGEGPAGCCFSVAGGVCEVYIARDNGWAGCGA